MREAAELLQHARHIFATTHVDPDGDAIGSLLGFAWILRRLGKRVTVSMQDPVPWRFEYLPGASEVQATRPTPNHDLLVSLDASDFGRVGTVIAPEDRVGRPLLMIDHHVTNDLFGTVNVLDPQAAATTEIVYFLSLELGITPDEATAICLLTGLVTDTLGFRTSNTTPRTLEVAQALMQAGANLADISQRSFNSNSYPSLRLTADALARMTLDHGILWTEVTLADMQRAGAEAGDHAGIVGLLNSVREAKISAVLREKEDGRIDVSLRCKPGINVATAALALGGGGHPLAAGATLAPPLAAARERVLAQLRTLLVNE